MANGSQSIFGNFSASNPQRSSQQAFSSPFSALANQGPLFLNKAEIEERKKKKRQQVNIGEIALGLSSPALNGLGGI